MHIETASKPAVARHSLAGRVEHAIGRFAELAAGILVLVEIAILFAGVVSRYVIHRPFTWSDELASILFLWLAMLGAVVAYRRSEHMRMSALVDGAGPRIKSILEALALVAGLAFLMLVLGPALEYAHDEIMIVTPALEIPNVWRAAALPVGLRADADPRPAADRPHLDARRLRHRGGDRGRASACCSTCRNRC